MAAFDEEVPEEPLGTQEIVMYITVISAVFTRGNKWRFATGGMAPFWASIEDEAFWDRVEGRHDLFGYGDVLKARRLMEQSRKPNGELETEWTVLEVLDHTPGSAPTPTLWATNDESGSQGIDSE